MRSGEAVAPEEALRRKAERDNSRDEKTAAERKDAEAWVGAFNVHVRSQYEGTPLLLSFKHHVVSSNLSLPGVDRVIAERVAEAYRAKGWKANLVPLADKHKDGLSDCIETLEISLPCPQSQTGYIQMVDESNQTPAPVVELPDNPALPFRQEDYAVGINFPASDCTVAKIAEMQREQYERGSISSTLYLSDLGMAILIADIAQCIGKVPLPLDSLVSYDFGYGQTAIARNSPAHTHTQSSLSSLSFAPVESTVKEGSNDVERATRTPYNALADEVACPCGGKFLFGKIFPLSETCIHQCPKCYRCIDMRILNTVCKGQPPRVVHEYGKRVVYNEVSFRIKCPCGEFMLIRQDLGEHQWHIQCMHCYRVMDVWTLAVIARPEQGYSVGGAGATNGGALPAE